MKGHYKETKFEIIRKSPISSLATLKCGPTVLDWIASNLKGDKHTFLQFCKSFLFTNPNFKPITPEEEIALGLLEKNSDPWKWSLHAFQRVDEEDYEGYDSEDIQDAIVQLILRYYQDE